MTAELRVPRGSASDGDGTENDPPGDPVGESDLHEAAAKLDQGKVLGKVVPVSGYSGQTAVRCLMCAAFGRTTRGRSWPIRVAGSS